MIKVILILILPLLSLGCSSTPRHPDDCPAKDVQCVNKLEERLERRERDQNNWSLCERIYKSAGVPTVHRHHHGSRMTENQTNEAIKDDLFLNRCKFILREAWEE